MTGAGPSVPALEHTLSSSGAKWAIATPHWAASEVGAAAFRAEGNAVDAALAAAVALAVTYPHNCSVGGDLFALVRRHDGDVVAVNASGAAPMALSADAVRTTHVSMPEQGPLTVTVPGAVGGWHALAELGSRLPFRHALEPAITLANDGVPLASSLAAAISDKQEILRADPGCAALFFQNNEPLREGDLFRQPSLARTLETIAAEGPTAVYGSEVGRSWIDTLNAYGSPMTVHDLATHHTELTQPLVGSYRDLEVLVPPPNSQGFVLLEILATVEEMGLDPNPTGPDAPMLAEVFRRASADRDRFLADPHRTSVLVGDLLSEDNIARIAGDVRRRVRPMGTTPPHAGDTVALVATDGEGWAVSLIQSLYFPFGSAILDQGTGVIMHNRGACFSLDSASPNVLQGGKRPLHTLMPVIASRGGAPVGLFGSMGAGGQPQINAMSLFRLFDLGMDARDVLHAPRWLVGGWGLDAEATIIEAESRVPRETVEAFEKAGFGIRRLEEWSEKVGHAHIIASGGDRLDVATDPRADGSAKAG